MSVCTQVSVDHNGDAGNEVERFPVNRGLQAWVRLALCTIRARAKSDLRGLAKEALKDADI